MDAATEAKTAVEDAQRELRRSREEKGERFVPRFFTCRDGRWVPKIRLARCNCAMPSLRFAQPTAGKRCRVDSIDRGFHVGSGNHPDVYCLSHREPRLCCINACQDIGRSGINYNPGILRLRWRSQCSIGIAHDHQPSSWRVGALEAMLGVGEADVALSIP